MDFCQEPMDRHQKGGIGRAGDHYAVLQASEAAKRDDATTLANCREWPLILAATMDAEQKAMDGIAARHDLAHRFNCVLPCDRTLKLSTLMFKLLSRQACRFHELRTRHLGFPFVLWLLLKRPEEAMTRIRRSCRLARGDYGNAFIDHYGLDHLTGPDALAELTLIATLVKLSTVVLENGNGGIKHALDVMSTHTVLPPLERISAERMLTRIRQRQRLQKRPSGMHKKLEGPGNGKRMSATFRREQEARRILNLPEPQRREVKRGGGAWRTYISEQCRGTCRCDFKRLAQDYRALPPGEKQRLKAKGRVASQTVRAGGAPFGRRPREEAQEAAQAAKRQRVLALEGGQPPMPAVVPSVDAIVPAAEPALPLVLLAYK